MTIPFKAAVIAVAATVFALPAAAATLGQPFFAIDAADGGNPRGSLLNFFEPFGPSDIFATTLRGTVTEEFGAPGVLGKDVEVEIGLQDSGFGLIVGPATMTIGDTTAPLEEDFDISSFPLQPDRAGPGDLNIAMFVAAPFIFDTVAEAPLTLFTYTDDFADWGSFVGDDSAFPGFEMLVSIFLDEPRPTKFFNAADFFGDPDAAYLSRTYVEGELSITRIEFATIGGAPLPDVSPVPLPAALPLLIGGLGALALARRRRG